jgi:predicted NAD/FAD-binding protein
VTPVPLSASQVPLSGSPPRVAVIGSGIAGLAAAHALRSSAQVSLFEAGRHFGGHANTVDLTLEGLTHGVDTGFLVCNPRTYPGLMRLFAELGIEPAPSEMSFSVQVPRAFGTAPLEWSGSSIAGLFCQRVNLLRPRFWRMLRDLLRFNRVATQLALAPWNDHQQPLGHFLQAHRFGSEFRDWYLLPMIGCIWSAPTRHMLRFPVGTLVHFFHNHGLLQVTGRPQWLTVPGGSRRYVERIVAQVPDARLDTPVRRVLRESDGVRVVTDAGEEFFDRVVIATHTDQALAMLADADAQERAMLGAIRYQRNEAVLHTDAAMLPAHQEAWAAWNFEAGADAGGPVCLHYLINRLQPLPWRTPVIVSLNPLRTIAPARIAARIAYEHPVFDAAAVRAQALLSQVQGRRRTWFCGAWTGYGFHEDGLVSGQAAARALLLEQRIAEAEEAIA